MVMACKIKLYYSESDLKYMCLGIKIYRHLTRIVDLLHYKLIFLRILYVKAYISSIIRFVVIHLGDGVVCMAELEHYQPLLNL